MNPSYVLDEMLMYEILPLINNIYRKSKESWEQARFIGYITAQVNSTKKLKMSDVLAFPWDEEKQEENTTISNSDVKRLRAKANKYIQENK